MANHKLGAHLSMAKGFAKAVESIADKGGNCLQIFSSSPRAWAKAGVAGKEIDAFLKKRQSLGIDPVFFHAIYLINLADPGSIGHLSKTSLIHELSLAAKMKIKGIVVHLGSFKERGGSLGETPTKAYNKLLSQIGDVLAQTPKETLFIVENAGTRKIGKNIEEIAKIISALQDQRLRVCLDTCHLHAAGYDLSTAAKLAEFLDQFERKIGLDKLELWHLNDSRDPFGSCRDRHANIGDGEIGLEVFRLLLNHPEMKKLPFIIETPGFNQAGPDKKNLDILKTLVV